MEISIVIATRNRDTNLEYSLRSLCNQSFSASRFEVIIVDYGGTSNTKKLVGQFDRNTFIYLKVNESGVFNESRAKNIGIRRASGQYILCTNADIIFSQNAIAELYNQLNMHGSNSLLHLQRRELPDGFPLKLREKLLHKGYDKYHRRSINLGPTTAMGDFQATRKSNWLAIKGYDERMVGWGAMDLDLARRMAEISVNSLWLDENNIKIFHQYHDWRKDRKPSKYNINQILANLNIPYMPNNNQWGNLVSINSVTVASSVSKYWPCLKNAVESNASGFIVKTTQGTISADMMKKLISEIKNYDMCILRRGTVLTIWGFNIYKIYDTIALSLNQRFTNIAHGNSIKIIDLNKIAKKYSLNVLSMEDKEIRKINIIKYIWSKL